MSMSRKIGFTLIEILVVIAIIALLLGILVPVVKYAQTHARQVAVTSQIQTIATGLETFKTDFGYYPSSVPQTKFGVNASIYRQVNEDANHTAVGKDHVIQGFHRLSSALLGLDRLGCPAKRGTGAYPASASYTYSERGPDSVTGWYYSGTTAADRGTFGGNWRLPGLVGSEYKTPRKGPYVSQEGLTVLKDKSVSFGYLPVICDKFEKKPKENIEGTYAGRSIILYYQSNPRGLRIDQNPNGGTLTTAADWETQLYYSKDNSAVTQGYSDTVFWDAIEDKDAGVGTAPNKDRVPHNREGFLLISPGADQKYFTADDIKNWAD